MVVVAGFTPLCPCHEHRTDSITPEGFIQFMKPLLEEIRRNPLRWLLAFVPGWFIAVSLKSAAHALLFVLSMLAIGEQAAQVAAGIQRGEAPDVISSQINDHGTPVYDWRELRRSDIRQAAPPAAHIIRQREPQFWDRYRWPALGAGALGGFQAALIAGLLVNRRKRRLAEDATALIADISSRFVNLPAAEVDREIHEAQRRICGFLGFDVSVLWEWNEQSPGWFSATHGYSMKNGAQQPMRMSADDFPWVRQEIFAGRVVKLRSLAEIPDAGATDRNTARRMGIKSSLSLPLSLGGKSPIGILCFNTTRRERRWSPVLVDRLKLVAEIIANALARKRADQDLRASAEAMRLALEQTLELRASLAHVGRVSLLGQLASALAHELSQPLGAILRNAEAAEIMLKDATPDIEELRAIVDDILRDDHRAAGVIDKLRSLLGKGELASQPLALSAVISDVLALVKADASARRISFDLELEAALPKVLGDRIHLQQVLLNLIVNAMDALEEQDGPDRRVRVSARLLDTAAAEVRVCDNGPGIPADRLGRVFEPFYTTKAVGMGMGLPVSKTIIEAHGGKLTAENRPAGGACFWFTLQVTHAATLPA